MWGKNTVWRETITHPTILHRLCPTEDRNGNLDIPVFLEKIIVSYNLVGSGYGDGGHFRVRFLKNDKVYEADGMEMKIQLINRNNIRAALSKELPGNHELTLAGHINLRFNRKNELTVKGKKLLMFII